MKKYQESFWGDGNVVYIMTVVVITNCIHYVKTHQIILLKSMNVILNKLYPKKADIIFH